jgi:peptidoglycan LD-endopeptidase LytH
VPSATVAAGHGAAASGRSVDGLADVDVAAEPGVPAAVAATAGTAGTSASPSADSAPPAADLGSRDLEIPVEGVRPEQLTRTFEQQRSGTRLHQAIDILAPRNTPVKAVEDGTIARLFLSKAGGLTVYQFDPSEAYAYYYAHLERYAEGLKEGDHVRKGQVLGYVGTSGNAPPETPHLHFAIFRLTAAKHWWEGTPIDPYDILR